MPKKIFQLLFGLLFLSSTAFAQFVGFEEGIPQNFESSKKKELALSTSFYKEGSKSSTLLTDKFLITSDSDSILPDGVPAG